MWNTYQRGRLHSGWFLKYSPSYCSLLPTSAVLTRNQLELLELFLPLSIYWYAIIKHPQKLISIVCMHTQLISTSANFPYFSSAGLGYTQWITHRGNDGNHDAATSPCLWVDASDLSTTHQHCWVWRTPFCSVPLPVLHQHLCCGLCPSEQHLSANAESHTAPAVTESSSFTSNHPGFETAPAEPGCLHTNLTRLNAVLSLQKQLLLTFMSSCSTASKQNESGSRTRASNHNSTANSRQILFRFCAPYHWMPSISAGCSQDSRPASTQTCGSPGGCSSLISVTQEMQLSKPEMPQLQHSCTHPALSLKHWAPSALWHSYPTAQRKQDRKTKQLSAQLEYHVLLQFQTTLLLLQQGSTSLLSREPVPSGDAPEQSLHTTHRTAAPMSRTGTNPAWGGIQPPRSGCLHSTDL